MAKTKIEQAKITSARPIRRVNYFEVSSRPGVIYYPNYENNQTIAVSKSTGKSMKIAGRCWSRLQQIDFCERCVRFYDGAVHCDDCHHHHSKTVSKCTKCNKCTQNRGQRLTCMVCNRTSLRVYVNKQNKNGFLCGQCTDPDEYICRRCYAIRSMQFVRKELPSEFFLLLMPIIVLLIYSFTYWVYYYLL